MSEQYKNCLELLDDITQNESDKKVKTPFLSEEALNLDAVEKATARVKNKATMDVAFGISKNEGKSGQFALCEYRLNYKSVNKISKSGLDAKIKGSSELLGAEIPIYKPYLFVFNPSIKASAISKLRRFSANKAIYRALDIQDLYDDFFKIENATTFGKIHK